MTVSAACSGPASPIAAIAMVIVWWPIYARLMRRAGAGSSASASMSRAGNRRRRRDRSGVLTKHIMPLCWTPTLVNADHGFRPGRCCSPPRASSASAPHRPAPNGGSMISEGASKFYSWWIAPRAQVSPSSASSSPAALSATACAIFSIRGSAEMKHDPGLARCRCSEITGLRAFFSAATAAPKRCAVSTCRCSPARCSASSANPARVSRSP